MRKLLLFVFIICLYNSQVFAMGPGPKNNGKSQETDRALKEADQAMYLAKQSGKGNYIIFEDQ